MAAILQNMFPKAFPSKYCFLKDLIDSIGLGNGSGPNRQQAVTWTSFGLDVWHNILSHNEST